MRVLSISAATILLLAATSSVLRSARPQAPQASAPAVPGLTLSSSSFEDGAILPPKYTQAALKPISPELRWTNVPENTVSFVLIFHDPEAVQQKGPGDFLHWMLFNIPGTARELPENVPPNPALADGTTQAKNGRGEVGFRGPGAGAAGPYHHYTFELYALDTKLDLSPDASRADVLKALDGHVVGKAVLVGRFHR